jgi:hypothetical protein
LPPHAQLLCDHIFELLFELGDLGLVVADILLLALAESAVELEDRVSYVVCFLEVSAQIFLKIEFLILDQTGILLDQNT